jgi:hypothetical protein
VRFTVLLIALAPLLATTPAHAAVCADFPNQAAAQKAHDTIDADHDGVYCETLPCPCLKPAQHRPRVGPPVALHHRTKSSGCRLRGALPDPACTPGSHFRDATPQVFCKSGYTALLRNVTPATEATVYAEYGIASHRPGQYEVDHLIPLEAGGSNSVANLFPEAARPRPGFHEKDRVEDQMHARICDDHASYRSLQRQIARDWTRLYRRWFEFG